MSDATNQDATFLGDVTDTQGDSSDTTSTSTDGGGEVNPLEQLVGEGKKYKSVEDLAKAYMNADQFIETLKTEKRQLEQDFQTKLTEARTVEDVLAALNNQTSSTDGGGGQAPPVLDENVISQTVDRLLSLREQRARQAETVKLSWSKMEEAFGGKPAAVEIVKKFIGNDPTKRELVDKLGATDPATLVNLMKSYTPPVENFTEDNQTKSSKLPDGSAGKLTWEMAKKLRKENPALYNSRQFQSELHRAAASNPNFFK